MDRALTMGYYTRQIIFVNFSSSRRDNWKIDGLKYCFQGKADK